MRPALWMIMATFLGGCAPVVVGAAGALVVDEVMERERGGDGLF